MIYLDSAATTLQKPPQVARASAWAMGHLASPGRGGHSAAMAAADTAFACRQEAARLFHLSDPERVGFTFNATHALNIAIKSLVRPGSTVVISGYEHNAVTRPLHAIPNVTVRVAESTLFDRKGAVEAFRSAITPEVSAVVCCHVSNVFGFILPVEEIAGLCRERNVPLIVDASQSAGCVPLDMEALGTAYMAMPGHKGLYGPQGTGLLLCGDTAPQPLLEGGTGSASLVQTMPDFLPDRLEAGTHNVTGIAGLLEGLRFVRRTGVENIGRRESALICRLSANLEQIPGITLFRAQDPRAQAGVLSLQVEGMDSEELGERLGRRGVAVRAGLHCAPLAHKTAGTLEEGTVRLSVSAFNQPWEMDAAARQLRQVCSRAGV